MCKENRYIRVDIVDNDHDYGSERVMETYILINPSMEKLAELQERMRYRIEEENEFCDNYGAIDDYIRDNFEVLFISDFKELDW